MPFQKNSLDLIWSEGAIDNIGFEKGLSHWHDFLKKEGFVAVTCPSWLTIEQPTVVQKFWTDAGSRLDSISENIETMQKCGYQFIASFALPEQCWTVNYFIRREKAINKLLEKYVGNEFKIQTIEELLEAFDMKKLLSHKDCPYDNAVAEAIFKIIKIEFVRNEPFEDLKALKLKL